MNKEAYFEELQEIVEDKLYLTESTEEIDTEIKANMWGISLNEALAAVIHCQDLKAFLQQVKQNRQAQLQKSGLVVDLLYYLWYDGQAGQLRFNFINSNHSSLPFAASLQVVETEAEIIEHFLEEYMQVGIGFESAEDSPSVDKEYKLRVYTEVIKRNNHSS